jgi:regulatory protein
VAKRRHASATAHGAALLARRERTTHQLRQALLVAEWPESEVDAAIASLKRVGYLNEQRAAQLLADKAASGRGKAAIEAKLLAAGVDEATTAKVLPVRDEEAEARELLRRRGLAGVKAARFLSGRGFDEALICKILPELDA